MIYICCVGFVVCEELNDCAWNIGMYQLSEEGPHHSYQERHNNNIPTTINRHNTQLSDVSIFLRVSVVPLNFQQWFDLLVP